MVRVVAWDPKGPEFKPRWATELIHQGVDSACHPSEVGEMSTSVLGPVYAPVRIGVPYPCVSYEATRVASGRASGVKPMPNHYADHNG